MIIDVDGRLKIVLLDDIKDNDVCVIIHRHVPAAVNMSNDITRKNRRRKIFYNFFHLSIFFRFA